MRCFGLKKYSIFFFICTIFIQTAFLWSCGQQDSKESLPADTTNLLPEIESEGSILPFKLPTQLGSATYRNTDANYAFTPQAAFFDAYLDSNNRALTLQVILTDNPNICMMNPGREKDIQSSADANNATVSSDAYYQYFPKNAKFMAFELHNLDTNNTLPLVTGEYTIDSNKIADLYSPLKLGPITRKAPEALAAAYFVQLDDQCAMKLSFTANSGVLNLTDLNLSDITKPETLELKANYKFQINNTSKSDVDGTLHAYACGGLFRFFFPIKENNIYSLPLNIKCE